MLQFFKGLIGKGQTIPPLSERLGESGEFTVEVAGVSFNTHNLDLYWEATSNRWQHRNSPDGDYWEQTTDAKLISRPQNAREIAVVIAGKEIGALRPAEAIRIHKRLQELGYERIDAPCRAVITGRQKWWEVKLDFSFELITKTEAAEASTD